MTVDKMVVGWMALNEMTVDKMVVNKMLFYESQLTKC